MRRQHDRVHGPYYRRGKWRACLVPAGGKREDRSFATREAAERWIRDYREAISEVPPEATINQAIDRYKDHLIAKGNKPTSYEETPRRLRRFFRSVLDAIVDELTEPRAKACYTTLVDEGLAVDSHRNYLAEARSFLRWCKRESMARTNVLEEVQGVGRRSHGKPQLRLDEARLWYKKARELAEGGDEGAVAALLALLLSCRATEIVTLRVRDVDDGGALLWITESKTEAGKRALDVPDELRSAMKALATGRERDAWLFPGDSESGHRYRDWVRDEIHEICDLANVPRVTTHGQRGLHAALGIAKGLSARVVADTLGHESTETTLESYATKASLRAIQGGKR